MHKNSLYVFSILVFFISGCASYFPINTNRNPPAEQKDTAPVASAPAAPPPAAEARPAPKVDRKEELNLTALEIQKYAYELGLNPKASLKEEEKKQILDRKKLRQLERALDSQKERLQYSKVLPWLKNDEEKIEVLSIPSVEGRQVWINKNKIWSRAKDLKNFDDVVEAQDIALGMPADYVKKSWGEPDNVESSGNPIYKNERWQYNRQVSTPLGYKQEKRLVYFEGGRVVGWETE